MMNYSPVTTEHVPPIDVVLACDHNYITQLAVTCSSIARHKTDTRRLNLHVICTGVDRACQAKFEACMRRHNDQISVYWTRPPAELTERYRKQFSGDTSHLTAAAIYRLVLDDVLEQTHEVVIYIDVDTVVRSDLGELVNADLAGCAVAGVRDFTYMAMRDRYPDRSQRKVLNVDDYAPRINTGLMVIHRERFRQRELKERALSLLHRAPRMMRARDEDALNAAMNGEFQTLDARWNVQLGRIRPDDPRAREIVRQLAGPIGDKELLRQGKVLHYTGPKPWQRGLRSPGCGQWWRALRNSGWFDGARYRRERTKWLGRQLHRYAGCKHF